MPVPLKRAPLNKPSELSNYADAKGPFWVMDSDGEKEVLFSQTGVASEKQTPSMTLVQAFDKAVKRRPNKVVLRTENMPALKKGETAPEALPLKDWKSWTWKQYSSDTRSVAKAMIACGLEQHDAVNIFGFNSPEWFIGMMGAIFAGGKAAGIYPSDGEDQVQYKSFHSNASVAIVENDICFTKFANVIEDLPYLKAIVCWDMANPGNITREDGSVVEVFTFKDFVAKGKAVEDSVLDERIAKIKPTHACALIYTSGTTGRPKAVMISHDNLIFESSSVLPLAGNVGGKNEEERIISYLPLSHVAGMMVDVISPIVVTANFKGWLSVNFARNYDLKAGTLGQRLGAVEPTIFLGVPRVWEKIAEKLQAVGAATKGLKKKLSTTAKKRGLQAAVEQQIGRSGKVPSMGPLGIYKLLLKVIKKKLGLAKCKFAFAGAAPMTRETLSYFGSLGIIVCEVYGMSECTGATTFSTLLANEFGTVGFETPGAEVKCFKVDADGNKVECPRTKNILNPAEEEQGELCYRGRHIMLGYMANPKLGDDHVAEIEKKNADAIDEEGWLHSGDKGAISHLGMVRITGRYKELIIGAGGENIAPVPIEDALKKEVPAISNVMMVGDKRKFNVILITLKAVGATGELAGGSELEGPAAAYGATIEEAIKNGRIVDDITAALETVGKDSMVTPSNAARIQKFTILPCDFSVMGDELTATLKLKRSVVADKYANIIEALYESSETFVPYTEVGSYDLKAQPAPEVPEGSFKVAGGLEMVDSAEIDEEAIEAAAADDEEAEE